MSSKLTFNIKKFKLKDQIMLIDQEKNTTFINLHLQKAANGEQKKFYFYSKFCVVNESEQRLILSEENNN